MRRIWNEHQAGADEDVDEGLVEPGAEESPSEAATDWSSNRPTTTPR